MKKVKVFMVFVCVMATADFASADNIRGINIDFVTIGNAGNAADTVIMNDGTTGYGAVGYNYRVGKYEITNAQWNTFTAAAGVPTGNPSDAYITSSIYDDIQQPVNRVSWYQALQFCNYLTSGDKSKGAYQFSGNNINPGNFIGIDRETAISTYGIIYALPTEGEWYKAAYFKPDASGYSLYANGTDVPPIAGVNANYEDIIGQPWNIGTGTMEQNGTFDMIGNVYEWSETLIYDSDRVCRGSSYGSDLSYYASSVFRNYSIPYDDAFIGVGFRIVVIPEPATILFLSIGTFVLKRKI